MLRKVRKLASLIMGGILVVNTMIGSTMVSYAAPTAFNRASAQTVQFKQEAEVSQKELVLPVMPAPSSTSYAYAREVTVIASFASEQDKNIWLGMESAEINQYIRDNYQTTCTGDEGIGEYGSAEFESLTKDGNGIILRFSIKSSKANAKGTVSFQLGAAKASVKVVNTVANFGSHSQVSGSADILPSNIITVQVGKEQQLQLESRTPLSVETVEWFSSNPELISVTADPDTDQAAVVHGLKQFPFLDPNASYSRQAVIVYAKATTPSGIGIYCEKEVYLREADPEFTLTSAADQEFTLKVSEAKDVGVTILPDTVTSSEVNVTTKSSDSEVATAVFNFKTRQIKVTAGTKEGTSDITVSPRIKNQSCAPITLKVTVEDPNKNVEINHAGLSVDQLIFDMEAPEAKVLSFKAMPENASVNNISWTADSAGYVDIAVKDDGTAELKPLKPGKVTVRLKAEVNGAEKTDSCEIYILTAPELTLKVNGEESEDLFLVPQGKAVLSAESRTGYPETLAAKTTYKWTSSNNNVASASNAARSTDRVTIKAGETGDAEMTVTATTEIPGVTGTQKTTAKTLNVNVQEAGLTADIDPVDALMKLGKGGFFFARVQTTAQTTAQPRITDVSWESGNKKAVTVSKGKEPHMGVARAVGVGKASVEASVEVAFGGLTHTIKASASNATVTREKIPEFEFAKESITVKAGTDGEMAVIIATASDADPDIRSVQWIIGDESIAEISDDGLEAVIVGKKAGNTFLNAIVTVYINGEMQNITVKNTMSVKVTEDSLDVSIKPSTMELKAGEEKGIALYYKASPSNADYQVMDVEWTSDHEEVATVTGDGQNATVNGEGAGTATITAFVTVWINGAEKTYRAESVITVTEQEVKPEETVNVKLTPESLEIKAGETGALQITSDVPGAVERVVWRSSQKATATVAPVASNPSKAIVTGVAAGNAKITAEVTVRVNGKSETRTLRADILVTKKNSGGGSGGSSGGSSAGTSGSSGRRNNTENTLSGTWQRDAAGWWFKQVGGGYPANQWGLINQAWYYFGADGYMLTGWQFINNQWYYLTESEQGQGAMVTGWHYDVGYQKWFYLGSDGAMLTGWQYINDKWYYLNPISDGTRGAMAADTYIGDYYVNSDGAWVQ